METSVRGNKEHGGNRTNEARVSGFCFFFYVFFPSGFSNCRVNVCGTIWKLFCIGVSEVDQFDLSNKVGELFMTSSH